MGEDAIQGQKKRCWELHMEAKLCVGSLIGACHVDDCIYDYIYLIFMN